MFPRLKLPKKTIYLDHAASTPVSPGVLRAMLPFFSEEFGNPSALYKLGVEANLAMIRARENVAKVLGVRKKEIIFTAGATESVNLAILGIARSSDKPGRILTTPLEHNSVLEVCRALEKLGWVIEYMPVDRHGLVNPGQLENLIKKDTKLISIGFVNGEIGTVQPIRALTKTLTKLNQLRRQEGASEVILHTDASQAPEFFDIFIPRLGVDLLTLNGSKIYGPKQSGILYVREGVKLEPVIYGGGQENGLRSGTESVANAVGFASALETSQKTFSRESQRLSSLRDYFLKNIQLKIPKVELNGPALGKNRSPSNINIVFEGTEGEAVVIYLDSYNIAVSTGSACDSIKQEASQTLQSIGKDFESARSSVRFSFGRGTRKKDLDYILKILPVIIEQLRKVQELENKNAH